MEQHTENNTCQLLLLLFLLLVTRIEWNFKHLKTYSPVFLKL